VNASRPYDPRARFGSLEVDELTVRKLRVIEREETKA